MSTENDYKSILITEKSLANTCEETDNETTNDSDNISNSSMIKMDKISSKVKILKRKIKIKIVFFFFGNNTKSI